MIYNRFLGEMGPTRKTFNYEDMTVSVIEELLNN